MTEREDPQLEGERAERRELERLRALARQARELIDLADKALAAAEDATNVYNASSYMRGSAQTFARGLLALIQLA